MLKTKPIRQNGEIYGIVELFRFRVIYGLNFIVMELKFVDRITGPLRVSVKRSKYGGIP